MSPSRIIPDQGWRPLESLSSCAAAPGRLPSLSCGRGMKVPEGGVSVVVVRSRRKKDEQTESLTSHAREGLVRALTAEGAVVERVMDSRGLYLRHPHWFQVLEALGHRHEWQVSLEVFRWIQMQGWYRHNLGFYSKLISIMGKAKKVKLAKWLFVEMRRNGVEPDTSAYNAVISSQVRNPTNPRAWETGLRFLEDMKERSQAQPNIVTYNTLIRACGLAGEFDVVNALFVELRKEGLAPDLYTFNGILDAYGKAGHLAQMENMISVMEAEFCKPGLITFNILIDVYGKAGAWDKMDRVYNTMTAARKIPPDLATFHSMMSNYGRAGMLDKMESTFSDMSARGLTPTFVSYEIRIRAHGQAGDVGRMEECLQDMVQAKVKLMPSTFTAMMEGYCHHGCFHRAEMLLQRAPKMGLYPDPKYYGSILKAYGKAGQMQQVDRLLNRMRLDRVEPNETVFLDLLEVYSLTQPEIQRSD